jgi:hypothetical protein
LALQLQPRASQLQHWLPMRASQFLRIRMDMSHEAAKETAFTISLRYRRFMIQERRRLNARREIRRHRARIIMNQVPILADNENLA